MNLFDETLAELLGITGEVTPELSDALGELAQKTQTRINENRYQVTAEMLGQTAEVQMLQDQITVLENYLRYVDQIEGTNFRTQAIENINRQIREASQAGWESTFQSGAVQLE